MPSSLLLLIAVVQLTSPDTLVVCPTELRPALVDWLDLRQRQGHRVLVMPPLETAGQLRAMIRRIGSAAPLRYLILVGDVPDTRFAAANQPSSIPTGYVRASVNTRWGSEPSIATDISYADLDGDGAPDLAVGRIPADSPAELATFVRKLIRYEEQTVGTRPPQRLHVTAGMGRCGMITDALLEATAQQVFRSTVPNDYVIDRLSTGSADSSAGGETGLVQSVHEQLCEPGLAWVYLGHGLPTELDRVRTAAGTRPLLSVHDVPHLRRDGPGRLAVLLACYAGAIDSQPDCLAEELVLADQGPIAVIAATRVSMPYGNTVLGYELLRASFQDRPATLGDILRLAQQRALNTSTVDPLRGSLDQLASGLSPPPVDLDAERREHVLMYQFLGDPLSRSPFARPTARVAQSDERDALPR